MTEWHFVFRLWISNLGRHNKKEGDANKASLRRRVYIFYFPSAYDLFGRQARYDKSYCVVDNFVEEIVLWIFVRIQVVFKCIFGFRKNRI